MHSIPIFQIFEYHIDHYTARANQISLCLASSTEMEGNHLSLFHFITHSCAEKRESMQKWERQNSPPSRYLVHIKPYCHAQAYSFIVVETPSLCSEMLSIDRMQYNFYLMQKCRRLGAYSTTLSCVQKSIDLFSALLSRVEETSTAPCLLTTKPKS